jgi:hypothetical protein
MPVGAIRSGCSTAVPWNSSESARRRGGRDGHRPAITVCRLGFGGARTLLFDVRADESEFLLHSTASRLGRVLIRFDMSAGRQPQAGVDVVDQQHAAVVESTGTT